MPTIDFAMTVTGAAMSAKRLLTIVQVSNSSNVEHVMTTTAPKVNVRLILRHRMLKIEVNGNLLQIMRLMNLTSPKLKRKRLLNSREKKTSAESILVKQWNLVS